MTSPESQDAITSWARDKRASGGGFPEENILCNEIPGSSGCAVADGVAGFVQVTRPSPSPTRIAGGCGRPQAGSHEGPRASAVTGGKGSAA